MSIFHYLIEVFTYCIHVQPVYWMFVGALFRESSTKILKHYRHLVDKVEDEANIIAQNQLEEEENRLNFIEMVRYMVLICRIVVNVNNLLLLIYSKSALKGSTLF